MTAFIVVDISVENAKTYDQYKLLAPPSIAKYGGRYVARGGKTQLLEGSWQPSRLVILEFPSMERAQSWWSSAEYAEAKALRQRSASTKMVLIEGLEGAP